MNLTADLSDRDVNVDVLYEQSALANTRDLGGNNTSWLQAWAVEGPCKSNADFLPPRGVYSCVFLRAVSSHRRYNHKPGGG